MLQPDVMCKVGSVGALSFLDYSFSSSFDFINTRFTLRETITNPSYRLSTGGDG